MWINLEMGLLLSRLLSQDYGCEMLRRKDGRSWMQLPLKRPLRTVADRHWKLRCHRDFTAITEKPRIVWIVLLQISAINLTTVELHATLYYCVNPTSANYDLTTLVTTWKLHVKTAYFMSDFGEYTQGITTPYTQDSSGAQTNNQRNAVARIESCPRLPARSDSTLATIDSDVTLRHGAGLLHASPERHPDGRTATGDTPVVSKAQRT